MGDAQRDLLGASHEARVLGAPARGDQPPKASLGPLVAGGGDVEEHVQQRQLSRFGAPDRAAGDGHRRAAAGGGDVGLGPGAQGGGVPLGGAGGLPRRAHRHGGRHGVELADADQRRLLDVRIGGQPRVGRIARELAAEVLEIRALVVGGERAHPHRAGQRHDAILGGAHVLAADLGDNPRKRRTQGAVQRPAAHPVVGLEHHHAVPGAKQRPSGGQARQAGAHDRHVHPALAPAPGAPAGGGPHRRGPRQGGSRHGARLEQPPAGEASVGHALKVPIAIHTRQ